MHTIISRKQAEAFGLSHYFTGGPCKHGHIEQRNTATRQCLGCLRTKGRRDYANNKDKLDAATRKWRKLNPEAARRHHWKSRGLPLPARLRPELCENCSKPSNGKGCLHLDHDHDTNTFRGWLCSNCNTGIGKLGDTIEGVQRAVKYLKRAYGIIE